MDHRSTTALEHYSTGAEETMLAINFASKKHQDAQWIAWKNYNKWTVSEAGTMIFGREKQQDVQWIAWKNY